MIRHKIKAFTLVELIVVITILAVLGTIAFVSFQGYAQSSRDSARITDLRSIQKVLALYKIESGFFPDADNAVPVTYLTSPIWAQGTFGENSRAAVKRISDIPVDPLTGTEYAYSTTYSKNEFEVGATFEGEGFSQNNVTSLAMAGDRIGTSYVNGEYNGQIIQKEIGGVLYVLAVPTIINADMGTLDYETIITNGSLAINKSNNLADSYSGTVFNTLGGASITAVNPSNIVVFSGSTSDLIGGDSTGRTALLTNLQAAYSGTISITSNPSSIGAMMNVNLGDSSAVNNYASSLVNNALGANIAVVQNVGSVGNRILGGLGTANYCGGDASSAYNQFGGVHNAPTARNERANAGLKTDGSIVVWGTNSYGGDQNDVPIGNNYVGIYSTENAFAALTNDGSIKVWGSSSGGGASSGYDGSNSHSHSPAGNGFTRIYSTERAFAALGADGSISAWGTHSNGGASAMSGTGTSFTNAPSDNGYVSIHGNSQAFMGLKADGSISFWGYNSKGGNSGVNLNENIEQVATNKHAFAGIDINGDIKVWGTDTYGGDQSDIVTGRNFVSIVANTNSFAALDDQGAIFSWGTSTYGPAETPVGNGFTKIYATDRAYAALHNDGSITAFGLDTFGGTLSTDVFSTSYINAPGDAGYVDIFPNSHVFNAMKADGSITSWGLTGYSDHSLVGNYDTVYVNDTSSAVLNPDGSINTWGFSIKGGTLPGDIATQTGFVNIFSSKASFTAIKADGTIESWGESYAGDTPTFTGSILNVNTYLSCP